MPVTEFQGSSVPLALRCRSILTIRRNHVVSIDGNREQELEDFELFQKHVTDRFLDLSSPESGLLSLPWLRKLLETFLLIEEEFKSMLILGRNSSSIAKPPYDRLISELLDRAVKALDICNAITDGVDSISHWQKQAVSALKQNSLEGQFRRTKKVLAAVVAGMTLDDRQSSSRTTERNWSFGLKTSTTSTATEGSMIKDHESRHSRSLSWSVSRHWSATKQLQAMTSSLVAPRGAELNGLALPIYTMNSILVLVMWVLVAAIPCQDRAGLMMHFPVPPRQLAWAGPMISLQERIVEEWKKKEKTNSAGLLEELQRLEKCGNVLIKMEDSYQQMDAERRDEVGIQADDLEKVCTSMEEGMVPFRRQVREVFHRIVRSRTEVLDCLDRASRSSTLVL
ncbi:protein ROH1A-like [Tasmannia lanceolata]|uniref:protein ROH1A-like n=1 Tax=Tasmannia lanceolata TaxID=3420 RepID=UPI0040645269